MPKVYNKRKRAVPKPPMDAVYVGRPTKWGNPFPVPPYSQEEAVEFFRQYMNDSEQSQLREQAKKELKGKDLVCWCAPKACHADILLEIANEE